MIRSSSHKAPGAWPLSSTAILAAALAVLTLPWRADAEVLITPKLTVEERYDSNAMLTENGADEDYITFVVPEIAFKTRGEDDGAGRFRLEGSYKFEARYYAINSDLDYQSHRAGANAELDAGRNSTLFAGDEYVVTRDSTDISEFDEQVVRTDIKANTVYAGTKNRLSETASIEFMLKNRTINYKDVAGTGDAPADNSSTSATLTAWRNVTPTMGANMSLTYARFSYETDSTDNEVDAEGLELGFKKTLSETSSIDARAGVAHSDAFDDNFTWLAEAGMNAADEDTEYSLRYKRQLTSGSGLTSELIVKDRGSLMVERELSRDLKLYLKGVVTHSQSEPAGAVEYLTVDINAEVGWKALRRLMISAGIGWLDQDSDTIAATDVTRTRGFLRFTYQTEDWRL